MTTISDMFYGLLRCAGDSALPLLPPGSDFVTNPDCPSSTFSLLQNPEKEVLICLLISLLDY